LIISVTALVLALAGTAFTAGSAVPGKNGVKASDIATGAVKAKKIAANAVQEAKIANGAVTTPKIGDKAVTSGKFFLSGTTTVSFGNVAGETCSSIDIPAAGVTANDHVVITPPTVWPDTFSITGVAQAGVVHVGACNTFTGGGSVDPDGAGGIKFLVIR
jgi:hypothetical protein